MKRSVLLIILRVSGSKSCKKYCLLATSTTTLKQRCSLVGFKQTGVSNIFGSSRRVAKVPITLRLTYFSLVTQFAFEICIDCQKVLRAMFTKLLEVYIELLVLLPLYLLTPRSKAVEYTDLINVVFSANYSKWNWKQVNRGFILKDAD